MFITPRYGINKFLNLKLTLISTHKKIKLYFAIDLVIYNSSFQYFPKTSIKKQY